MNNVDLKVALEHERAKVCYLENFSAQLDLGSVDVDEVGVVVERVVVLLGVILFKKRCIKLD